MKKFRIVLDGIAHEVEVEELGSSASAPVSYAPAAPVAAPAASAPVSAPAPAPKAAAGAGVIAAPLQGTILSVNVTEGQSVSAGDILVIIEAMKMENEIVAPANGKVVKIHTANGSAVSAGDALVTIE